MSNKLAGNPLSSAEFAESLQRFRFKLKKIAANTFGEELLPQEAVDLLLLLNTAASKIADLQKAKKVLTT